MSFFNSLHFLLITAAWIAAYFAYLHFSRRPRHEAFLLLMSVWWTHSFFEIPVPFLALKLAILSGAYYLATAKTSPRTGTAISVCIGGITILWWVYLRFPTLLGELGVPSAANSEFLLHRAFLFVGIPFTVCRMISFSVDVRRNDTPDRGLIPFLLYIMYFPTLMSGPVTVYKRFIDIAAPKVDRDYLYTNVVPGMKRIILGIFKRQLIASFLWSVSLPFIHVDGAQAWRLWLGAYSYYFYLFADFSGYTDLVLGMSKIMNVNLPENFNRPYFARSPLDFWQRWHISFLDWLRQYVMTPLYSYELRRFPFLPPALLSLVAISATFLFVGIWHGEARRYLLYGALNALVLWSYRLYDEQMRRRAPALRKRLLASPLVTGVSVVLCFHYVVFALMVFSLEPGVLEHVLRRIAHG
jgi:alginate O-acetyltransferase complex protein AlgI